MPIKYLVNPKDKNHAVMVHGGRKIGIVKRDNQTFQDVLNELPEEDPRKGLQIAETKRPSDLGKP